MQKLIIRELQHANIKIASWFTFFSIEGHEIAPLLKAN
jgi:hypothetical protein